MSDVDYPTVCRRCGGSLAKTWADYCEPCMDGMPDDEFKLLVLEEVPEEWQP